MQNRHSSFDPTRQLDLLIDKCSLFRPQVYKFNALYLQIIRETLPPTIRECIYQLILSNKNNISNLLIDKNKDKFTRNIDKIISDCTSILTIESLTAFSKTMEEERTNSSKELSVENLEQEKIDEIRSENSSAYSMSGSLEINSKLPINESINFNSWNSHQIDIKNLNYRYEKEYPMEHKLITNEDEEIAQSDSTEPNEFDTTRIDFFKSIFEMASSLIPEKVNDTKAVDQEIPRNDDNKLDLQDNSQQDFLLPEMPDELSLWTLSIENALNRRLRDLSHMINIELLRIGIINSFVPINLLDAVVLGQINTVNSPSNVLKLRLPASSPYKNELEIVCLLIRPSELEFDDLRLRQCRQKITEQQNILLKMIRQQRYWQNRSIANEVREQWWTNTTTKKTI